MAYRLDLPASLQVHPVFHVSLLRPYLKPSVFPDRQLAPPPPPPVTVGNDTEYEVESILDRRLHRHRFEYLVKWKGYPDHDASWEPLSNLHNAAKMVTAYDAIHHRPAL